MTVTQPSLVNDTLNSETDDLYAEIDALLDNAPNVLDEISKYVFTSKYARHNPELNRRETWHEAVERVEAMHLRKFSYLPEEDLDEIRAAFDLVREQRALPSMRSMQFGGAAVEAHNARLYNCLSPRTEFVTSEGIRTFKDFDDGDTIRVLGHSGQWRNAVVRNYGIGWLDRITFAKGKNRFEVLATADHRWLHRNGEFTEGVNIGDQIAGSQDIFSDFDWDNASPDEKLYWCYGLVYGDGTLVTAGDKQYSAIRLCGADKQYVNRFEILGFKSSQSLSLNGDYMAYTGSYLKTAPDPSVDSPELIRAFVRGYLDADGEKSDRKSDNKFLTIQSSDDDHIRFIRECFPIAGVFIVSEEDCTGQVTNFGTRPYTIRFRVTNYFRPDGSFIPGSNFRVEAIESNVEFSDLWCLEVEEDQSFVLSNGLVTGNCAVRHIDSIRSFSEAFYLLLCGCGVGFGITDRYLNRLPNLVSAEDKTGTVMVYAVEDTIEGWADSIEALLNCYFQNTAYSGRRIVFDYSKIRPEGAILKTGGGKAPGYKGLKNAHTKIKALLDRIIEEEGLNRLRTIDAYDILMHTADAVLSGGVRRSATSVIFDKDDELMLNAKVGNWFTDNPQRARSNNSVMLIRGEISQEEFRAIVERTRQWGEPGFVFGDHKDSLLNPCFEINFIPVTDDGLCGVQFCNLTTVNGAKVHNADDFFAAVKAAALIGTLQASYTDFKYLSNTAGELTRSESLLGVSITAMLENPDILTNPEIQQAGAAIAVQTNKVWAAKCDIPQAARVTAIKPEGTSTLAVGSMFSGIHAAHDHYMWRRIEANKRDNVYQLFKAMNPHLCEPSVWSENGTDDKITFPVVLPKHTLVKSQLSAMEHLNIIKSTQKNWVVPGTTEANRKPLHHNVSCTVVVQPDEWDDVARYLHAEQDCFAAVSLLGASGDKDYAQAPNEAVRTPEEVERFVAQLKNFIPVDYTLLQETEDGTTNMQEFSCGGGQCEL